MSGKTKVAGLIFVCLFWIFISLRPAAAQGGYVTISVSDPGTIQGVVKWTGTVPKIPKLPITKNEQVCDPQNTKTRDLERLLIGPDGAVENTVVYLKNVSEGKAMAIPDQRWHLDQKNCRYVPHILIVPVGSALQIESSDPILHTVHMSGAASNNIPFPFQGQYIPAMMREPGVVNLKCNAGHVWMNAEVIVVKNPYVAVTDEQGRFKISDVPPGDYEIEAWHEGWRIISEESVLDVSSQVEVKRPIYSSPETWDKKVTVKGGQTSTVDFALSER
ncbi:MAG TPA: carboxypeptidase regulatory-like domain-containing protein [Verrucomicrobiae bacterium]|nr:carboxypeptidase regulatory-like domain-containing protein [Verrucomicrobiae bacterium]